MVLMWTMLAMVAMMQRTAVGGFYVKLESFITLGMRNHFGASCSGLCVPATFTRDAGEGVASHESSLSEGGE